MLTRKLPASIESKFQQLHPVNQEKFLNLSEEQQLKFCSLEVMSVLNVVRKEMNIGSNVILSFTDDKSEFYLNASQSGNLVDKKGNEFENYICQFNEISTSVGHCCNVEDWSAREKYMAYRLGFSMSDGMFWGEDASETKSTGNNKYYRLVKVDLVSSFILFHALKGNSKAIELSQALMHESLKIRCESLFVGVSPNVKDIIESTDDWLKCRGLNKSVHPSFNNHCQLMGYPANHVHNRITQRIFGQTARQAISTNLLVGDDPTIGLDYQSSEEGQLHLARVKMKFTSYRKGTWQERADRAYYDTI